MGGRIKPIKARPVVKLHPIRVGAHSLLVDLEPGKQHLTTNVYTELVMIKFLEHHRTQWQRRVGCNQSHHDLPDVGIGVGRSLALATGAGVVAVGSVAIDAGVAVGSVAVGVGVGAGVGDGVPCST